MTALKSIEVLSPGLQTTIQDLGRFGYGHYGVPASGALDSFSLRIANRLVDNSENLACLETTLMGLHLKALTDVCVAVTGADLQLTGRGGIRREGHGDPIIAAGRVYAELLDSLIALRRCSQSPS